MNFSNEKIVGKIIEINNDDILPNRFQPRKYFDEEETLELAESIKEHGVLQPIVVRQVGDKYEIIAGERRYKANILAGNDSIPATVSNLNDKESSEIAVIENIQRQDLTPIEEAISYKRIIDMGYITQEELARKIGKSQSAIANKIRLLKLSDEVQDALMAKQISERHARSLLQLDSLNQQNELLKKIIKERLTVRKTDEEIGKMNNNEIFNNQNMMNNQGQESSINQDVNVSTPTVEPPVNNSYTQENNSVVSDTPVVTETPNMDVSPIMGTPVNNFAETTSVPVVEENSNQLDSSPTEQNVATDIPLVSNDSIDTSTEINNPVVDTSALTAETANSMPSVEEALSTPIQPVEPVTPEIPVNNIPSVDTPVGINTSVTDTSAPTAESTNSMPSVEEVPSTPIQPVEPVTPEIPINNIPSVDTPVDINTSVTDTPAPTVESTNSTPAVEEVQSTPISDISIFNPVVDTPIVAETSINTAGPVVEETPVTETPIPSFMPEQPTENIVSTPVVDLNQNNITEEPTEDIPLNNSIETPVEQTPDPIIVTNNETQYDPIMPDQPSDEPTLDFKTIINLIRQCSSTIEKCGYKIDTEEYDLEGKYQVTFIIEK